MKAGKDDKMRAVGEPPLRAANQPELPFEAPLPRPSTGWTFRGHVGYYGGCWVCENCGGVWCEPLALIRDPGCASRSAQGPLQTSSHPSAATPAPAAATGRRPGV